MNKIPLSLNIWKWYHIITLTFFILVLLWALIFNREALVIALSKYNPLLKLSTSISIDIILSLLIIYGIIKRHKIGYFASLVYIIKWTFRARNLGFDYTSSGILALLVALIVTYFVFKNSWYFGINLKKLYKRF